MINKQNYEAALFSCFPSTIIIFHLSVRKACSKGGIRPKILKSVARARNYFALILLSLEVVLVKKDLSPFTKRNDIQFMLLFQIAKLS